MRRDYEVSVDEEISDVSMRRPHVVLLGAGASKAALPNGDKNGRLVPLLREVAIDLGLTKLFPQSLQGLASENFEAAYSKLFNAGDSGALVEIDKRVGAHFSELVLPDQANLYDVLHLCLRQKDAIFTFNWDPFLIQSRLRVSEFGIGNLPQMFFLHGNVMVGFCPRDGLSGLNGRLCSKCSSRFIPSRLLFPVEKKDYRNDPFIEREWRAVRSYLKRTFMLTIFGYGAPTTDVEAVALLREGWGDPSDRDLEQTEVIDRPDCDSEILRTRWKPFIHTHHYEIHGAFSNSWLAKHPRRSGEAYSKQYLEARFISENPVPHLQDLSELVEWFTPLLSAEGATD